MAQRLWVGTLLFAAGLGVRYLLQTLGFEGRGLLIAMLAYELSPYALNYSARISAVLLPWAGLGWLIGLTVRSARTDGWRHPALFALTVVTVGSVNATSLALAGLGPVLWLVHAAVTDRSIGPRRALAAAARIGALTVAVSLWWMAGLALQGGYSLNVLRYTESREVVALASTAPEVLRGLGYWFFYGNDKLGPWIEPSVAYTQGGWLIFVGFGLAVLALGSAALVRWRHRSYFVLLAAVGALVAVGFHPPEDPSLLGSLFERYSRSGPLLAMRSLPRAVPLVALAMAVLLGVGINALSRRLRRVGAVAALLVLAGVILNNPAMWRIRMVEEHLNRPEEIPEYWLEAAESLDREDSRGETRVWEIPGSDFASYRWGNTVDPITPGLMDRGYVARELVPFGSPQSASLVGAVDRRLQEGTLDPSSLAPVARLMSVGDVVHRADLIFERYRTPRPVETAEFLGRVPGLGTVEAFGEPVPNVAGPEQTLIDEIHLARAAGAEHPSPVTRYGVADSLPIVRTRPVAGATVLVGDADGIVDAAGAGAVDLDRSLVFAADMAADPALGDLVLSEPAHIVVTDSNRRRAQRWGTLRENRGHTEQASEKPMRHDPLDNRLPAFDYAAIESNIGAVDDVRTVSEQRGPVAAQASAHGNPVTYTNDDRPYNALDGSLDTAWVVAAFSEAIGERLRLTLTEPAVVESMRLVQPQGRSERHTVENDRHITEVEIRVDSGPPVTVALDGRSLSPEGQTVPVGMEASVIEIEITATSIGRRVTYPAVAPVGFARVRPRPGADAGGDTHPPGAARPHRRRTGRPRRDRGPDPGAVRPPGTGAHRSRAADGASRTTAGRLGGRDLGHGPAGDHCICGADRRTRRARGPGHRSGVIVGTSGGRPSQPGVRGSRRRRDDRMDRPLRRRVRPVAGADPCGAVRAGIHRVGRRGGRTPLHSGRGAGTGGRHRRGHLRTGPLPRCRGYRARHDHDRDHPACEGRNHVAAGVRRGGRAPDPGLVQQRVRGHARIGGRSARRRQPETGPACRHRHRLSRRPGVHRRPECAGAHHRHGRRGAGPPGAEGRGLRSPRCWVRPRA